MFISVSENLFAGIIDFHKFFSPRHPILVLYMVGVGIILQVLNLNKGNFIE